MKKTNQKCSSLESFEIPHGSLMDSLSPIADVAMDRNVSIRTVRNWISQGLIVAYKRNNHAIFVDPRSLDAMLTRIEGGRK